MHKEITKEFLNFGLLKVVYFSNNHDLNHPGHLFLHFFPWFQLNIENCHPGWLSNLCLIWMWRFRPTFKNLILHHLEISRGPPLVISSSWKFTGDSTAPTPGIFQDLKIFRAWKFPWAVNEIVLKKFEVCRKISLWSNDCTQLWKIKIVIIDQKSIMDLIQFEATQNTVAMEENLEHFENGRKFKNPEEKDWQGHQIE